MTILFICIYVLYYFIKKIDVISNDITYIEEDNNACKKVTNLPLKAINNTRIDLIIFRKRRKYPSYYSGFV